jgi:hypothetical protein
MLHSMPSTSIRHETHALVLHRNFVKLVAAGGQLLDDLRVGLRDRRVGIVAPSALQENGAARLEFVGAHAAQQDLLVEGDDEIGLVTAVHDAAGRQPDAIAAGAGDAAGRRLNFGGNDLDGPYAEAHPRGDRCERLAAALRPLARITDDLDNMLSDGLRQIGAGRGRPFLPRRRLAVRILLLAGLGRWPLAGWLAFRLCPNMRFHSSRPIRLAAARNCVRQDRYRTACRQRHYLVADKSPRCHELQDIP